MILPKKDLRARARACDFIDALSDDKAWELSVKLHRKKRTHPQNSYFHGVPVKLLCDHLGYEVAVMKLLLLGGAFGWEEIEEDGLVFRWPVKPETKRLNVEEFNELIAYSQRWGMAQHGVYIPDPGEVVL